MHNTILIAILIVSIHTATDLSLSNCPSQFNITLANVTYSNGTEFRNFFFSAYNSAEHIDRVQKIVITANQEGDLQTYITEQAIFYIPIGVASLILYIIIVCCCVFEKSCPPCQSWRRDFTRRPYTNVEMRCVMFFAILFAFLIMGISIYAFTIIPGMKSDIENTKCSIFTMLDTTINGDSANNWGGFNQLKNQIGNISSLLSSAATQISTYLPGDRWLIDDMTIMKKANLDIYKKYRTSTLITPSPNQTTATTPGNPLPPINSVFIQRGLGPNGTFNTMVDDIDIGLRKTEKVNMNVFQLSNQAYFIDQSAQLLVQSQATIQANAIASQNILEMYLSQMNVTVSNMQDFSSSSFDGYFTWFLYALEATVGFVLASSLLIVLGTVAAHFFSILQCRSMIHLGWVIYGIGHLFVIILFMVCLSVGSIGHHTCGYFDKMLTNQTEFKRLGESFSQNIFTKVQACFFGNGNVLQSFGVAQQMKTVTDLFTNIVIYYDYEDATSANYVDKTISTGKINGWMAAMENYRLGIVKDSDDLQTANTNPDYSIDQLNGYSYQGAGVTTCSKDRWVFDKAHCTNPTETTYTSTTSATNGQALTTTNVMCISFNEKFISTYPSAWTHADFRRRYVQIKQNCFGAYNAIIAYGEALINFRDSRYNLFRGIKDDLNALLTQNNNFNSLLTGFRSRVDQFYSSVSTLNNLVTNQIDGLLVTSDCRIIKDNLMFTYNTFCINFMDRVVGLGMCAVILTLLMIEGLITANVFAVRVARMERDKRINALVDMSEVSDDLRGNQRQKSEQTSSSSDED